MFSRSSCAPERIDERGDGTSATASPGPGWFFRVARIRVEPRLAFGYLSGMSRTAPPRRITAEEAAGLVRSGDWVDYGFGIGRPDVFDRALAARRQCDFIHRNPMA